MKMSLSTAATDGSWKVLTHHVNGKFPTIIVIDGRDIWWSTHKDEFRAIAEHDSLVSQMMQEWFIAMLRDQYKPEVLLW